MPELWELRDEHERPTGRFLERGRPIPEGYWHIVVTIWTVTADGRILLTRRHPDKHWGLCWESTGGSVQAGESSREGALRELREETGLRAEESRFRLLSSVRTDRLFLDTYLYLCPEAEPALTLQPEEVVEARFVRPEEMEDWFPKMAPPPVERYLHDRREIEAAAAARRKTAE